MNPSQPIKIIISGNDSTEELEKNLSDLAKSHHNESLANLIERERPILKLKESDSELDYLHEHNKILRYRNTVDPNDFIEPKKQTIKGRITSFIHKTLWKLLFYQHNWIAFRNNAIFTQLTYELEFEIAARKELELKLVEIEKKLQKIVSAKGETE